MDHQQSACYQHTSRLYGQHAQHRFLGFNYIGLTILEKQEKKMIMGKIFNTGPLFFKF